MPQGPSSQNSAISDSSAGPDAALHSPQAADGVEFLGELRAPRIVESGHAELRPGLHRPRLDLAVARIETAVEGSKCGPRRSAVERACRAPSQRIRPPVVAPQIIVDLARFGAVIRAHVEHAAACGAAPLDAERLRFAVGKAIQESHAFEQERLLERFRRRGRKGDAVGDFRIRAARAGADAEGLVVGLDDAVGGKEAGGGGQPVIVRGAWSQDSLVPDLLQGRVHPEEDRVPILRFQNLGRIGRAMSVGSHLRARASGRGQRGSRNRGGREKLSSGNTQGWSFPCPG